MNRLILLSLLVYVLVGCDSKPVGVSDEFYEKYKLLGAPKIMYQCGDQVGYSAGIGFNATYNHLIEEAKKECGEYRKFKILKGQQYASEKK